MLCQITVETQELSLFLYFRCDRSDKSRLGVARASILRLLATLASRDDNTNSWTAGDIRIVPIADFRQTDRAHNMHSACSGFYATMSSWPSLGSRFVSLII